MTKGETNNMTLPDIELVAGAMHAAWMESNARMGLESVKTRVGEELMRHYDLLSEVNKDTMYRTPIRQVYQAILKVEEESHFKDVS